MVWDLARNGNAAEPERERLRACDAKAIRELSGAAPKDHARQLIDRNRRQE